MSACALCAWNRKRPMLLPRSMPIFWVSQVTDQLLLRAARGVGGVSDCDDKLTMSNRLKRKLKTEAFLRKKRIPYYPFLPCIESERATKLRSAKDVGIRIVPFLCRGDR